MRYIACYGDSLVQGFPYGPKYSWTAQVEESTKIKMLNYGICGECCDDIVFRVRQYALPEYVRHILFLGGANDILQGRKLDAVMDDYKRLLNFCEEKDYKLCIVLPFISADEWMNRQLLNLKHCKPTGMPITVMHHNIPTKNHNKPVRKPPNKNQIMLPIRLIKLPSFIINFINRRLLA